MKDGKFNFFDFNHVLGASNEVFAGVNDADKMMPILKSNDPAVIEKRKQIFADAFEVDALTADTEFAIETVISSAIGVFSGVAYLAENGFQKKEELV